MQFSLPKDGYGQPTAAWVENLKTDMVDKKNLSVDHVGQIPKDITNRHEGESFEAHEHISR